MLVESDRAMQWPGPRKTEHPRAGLVPVKLTNA